MYETLIKFIVNTGVCYQSQIDTWIPSEYGASEFPPTHNFILYKLFIKMEIIVIKHQFSFSGQRIGIAMDHLCTLHCGSRCPSQPRSKLICPKILVGVTTDEQ